MEDKCEYPNQLVAQGLAFVDAQGFGIVDELSQTWVERQEANAHLIAAAPELLEALESIVELSEPGRIYELKELGTLVGEMQSIARAAIAKAKGKA